jgi:hypothetical protein
MEAVESPPMTGIQMLTLAVFVLSTLLLAVYFRDHPGWRGWIAPAFAWSLHTAIFYVAIAYREAFHQPVLNLDYMAWSAATRLHGGLTIVFVLAGDMLERYLLHRRGPP